MRKNEKLSFLVCPYCRDMANPTALDYDGRILVVQCRSCEFAGTPCQFIEESLDPGENWKAADQAARQMRIVDFLGRNIK